MIAELHGMPQAELPWYEREIDPDSDTTSGKVVRLVGSHKRVLELGCATGYMSRVLRDRGCQVVAVEINPKLAERAAAYCERVVAGDIEQIDLERELGEDAFDVIVAADFLEHLKDPLRVLLTVKNHLLPGGYLVASVPNVAHGSVRLALLNGHFQYSDLGLLDRTHLRFFTRKTIQKLFEDAGFVVGHFDRQDLMFASSEVRFDRSAVLADLLETLSKDPDARAYQFILVAHPISSTDPRPIQCRIQALIEEKEAAQGEVGQLRQTVDEQTKHLDAVTARIEHSSRQNDTLRASLLDAHDQLVRRDDEIKFLKTREARLEILERELAQKDHCVREQEQRIGQQDQCILEQEQRIGQQDQCILEQEHSIQDLEQRIRMKDQHIADLQAALDRILYSPPGRLYRGIRRIVTLGMR